MIGFKQLGSHYYTIPLDDLYYDIVHMCTRHITGHFVKYCICVYILAVVPGPYPLPPGVDNVSAIRKWPPGGADNTIEVRRRRVPSNEGKIYYDIIVM